MLPNWDKGIHKTEKSYNQWVANEMEWRCFDADLVHLPRGSKIELCDLYDQHDQTFIPVKETWGSKAAYLFAQGVTAAEFFANSKEFRDLAEAKWPGILPPSFSERHHRCVCDRRQAGHRRGVSIEPLLLRKAELL